jgi:outer membrane immunogenic protein
MTMNFTHQQALFGRSNATPAAARGWRAAAIAVFAVLLSSSAYGADYSTPRDLPDYSLRGSETAPVGAPSYPRWEGFYFGAQGGQTFGAADFSNGTSSLISDILANTELQPIVANWSTLPKGSTGGQSYGGFIGYNYQWDDIVLGAELNYNRMSLRTGQQGSIGPILVPGTNLPDGSTVLYNVIVTSAASVAIHDIVTARARAGWTFDRFMPYGFAGLAVGRADVSRFATLAGSTITVTPPPTTGPGGISIPGVPVTGALDLPRDPQSQSQGGVIAYGFTAGLGVELGVTPNVFLRAEWEFVEFPNVSDFRVQINSARVGVGLKF